MSFYIKVKTHFFSEQKRSGKRKLKKTFKRYGLKLNYYMKNLIFGIAAIIFLQFKGIAQEKNDNNQKTEFKSASLITTYESEIIEYKFLSLVELNEEVEQIIQELDFSNSQNKKQRTLEVTIEIKVEITIGSIKGLMSGLIITSYAEAVNDTKRLKAMLLIAGMN